MKTAEPIILTSALPRWSSVVVWVICLLLAINFLWLGRLLELLAYLPWLAVASWGMYTLCWHPALQVWANRLVLVNLLRDRSIPFGAVADIRVTHSVLVKTADATYTSWGAPGLERFGPKIGDGGVSVGGPRSARSTDQSRKAGRGRSVSSAAPGAQIGSQAILQRAWSSWEQSQSEVVPWPVTTTADSVPRAASVTTTWNRHVLIGWAVIIVACALDVLLNF